MTADATHKFPRRALLEVIHHGVLIQDHVALDGGTDWLGPHNVSECVPHPDKGPLMFQDHDNRVHPQRLAARVEGPTTRASTSTDPWTSG